MSNENKYGGCPILNCGFMITEEDLPERPAATFGEDANQVIKVLADTTEELAVAAIIAHHVVDHTTAELMDTISALGAQVNFQAVALVDETDSVIISKVEYQALQGDANELAALHAAGVENWEGYAEVQR